MKAYTGKRCEKALDPCEQIQDLNNSPDQILCGLFQCERDPSNTDYGYMCNCKQGFISLNKLSKSKSISDPRCVDIDECKLSPRPCFNKGNCTNTVGSYYCRCTNQYIGDKCQNKNQLLSEWRLWGPWSECSVTCGTGNQYSRRECPMEANQNVTYCHGNNAKTQECSKKTSCHLNTINVDNLVLDCRYKNNCLKKVPIDNGMIIQINSYIFIISFFLCSFSICLGISG